MTQVLALSGGIGGAKLAYGLAQALTPEELTIVVNTGDDFEHLGFHVSPDIDSVLYALAELSDRERGWGRKDESWAFMSALRQLGEPTWFQLGDSDLAMHVSRTRRLREGQSLSQVTRALAANLGVLHAVAPMTDGRLRTKVGTEEGELDFQDYFVRRQCEPVAHHIRFEAEPDLGPSEALQRALTSEGLKAIVLCPSNPYLSIDPILATPGVREALTISKAPVVALCPLVGDKAFKGPTSKLMSELGVRPSVQSIAEHYQDFLDGLVIDTADAPQIEGLKELGILCIDTDIDLTADPDRVRLANVVLDLAAELTVRGG